MAIILRHFAEFGGFHDQLRKSGWLAINKFYPEKCHTTPTKHDGRAVLFAVAELHAIRSLFMHIVFDYYVRITLSLPRCMECQRGLATRKVTWRTRDWWQNERKLCLHSYTTWKNILSRFMTRRMVGGGDHFYLKSWLKLTQLERKRRFSVDINFARSVSAVAPSKKVQLG